MPIYENFPSKEPVVTASQDGLMSKTDKAKLDAIEANANNYVHPNNASTRHVTDDEKTQWSENTKYTNTTPTVNSIGGISAGSTFEDVPMSTMLTRLLYPYIAPTVSVAASPNGGVYEKGTSVPVTQVTVSIVKKSEDITKVELLDGTTSLGVKEDGKVGNVVFPLDSVSINTDKKFTAKVTDASGNTVTANSANFTFIYPYFQGVIAEDATINEALIKGLSKLIQAKGNKNFSFSANNQRMVIAYPKSYSALNKIVDPNQFDVTATWTATEINITTEDGVETAYYVYTSKPVTVENYKMQFNY